MNEALEIWVIYDHPKDFPDHFVVRRQWAGKERIHFEPRALLAPNLDEARKYIPQGLVCINRSPEDDPVIVESWL